MDFCIKLEGVPYTSWGGCSIAIQFEILWICAVTGSSLMHCVCGKNFNTAYCMLSVASVVAFLQWGTMTIDTSQPALLQDMCTICVCTCTASPTRNSYMDLWWKRIIVLCHLTSCYTTTLIGFLLQWLAYIYIGKSTISGCKNIAIGVAMYTASYIIITFVVGNV